MPVEQFLVTTDHGGRAREHPRPAWMQAQRLVVVALMLLIAASCGSGSGGESAALDTEGASDATSPDPTQAPTEVPTEVPTEQADEAPTTEPVEAATTAPDETQIADDADEADKADKATVGDEPDRTGLRVVTYPILGGLRVGIEPDVLVSSEGDYFTMRRAGSDGFAVFSRTSQAASDEPDVTSIDDFLAAARGYLDAEVTVTDDTIQALGVELTLHEFRGAELPPGPGLFATRSIGFSSNAWWTPGPIADVYLGEVEGGVLAIAAIGTTDEGLADAKQLVAELLPTLSLTTLDGSPAELPSIDDRYLIIGDPLDFRPATLDPTGAPEFTSLFAPIEPGSYQLGNLSVPITVDFGPGWFAALNFPTFVVLTELPVVGPGFRDVIFQQGPNAIGGVSLGPTSNTAPVQIDGIESFLADSPEQLKISNIDLEAQLGGLDAVRFDLLVDPAATCQPGDPCEFMISSAAIDFTSLINPGVVHRVWWIEDVPAGPLMITAAAAEADAAWLDTRAEELIAAISFGENG